MNSLYHNVLYDFWKDHYRIWFADYYLYSYSHTQRKILNSDYASNYRIFITYHFKKNMENP